MSYDGNIDDVIEALLGIHAELSDIKVLMAMRLPNEWAGLRTTLERLAAQARANVDRLASRPDPTAALREQLDPAARRRAFEAWKAGLRARK